MADNSSANSSNSETVGEKSPRKREYSQMEQSDESDHEVENDEYYDDSDDVLSKCESKSDSDEADWDSWDDEYPDSDDACTYYRDNTGRWRAR